MERAKHKHLLLFISSSLLSYFFLLLFALLISHHFSIASAQNATPSTVRVGVLLDLGTSSGKRSKTSISMALEDFYAINGNFSTRIELEFRDSMNEVVSAASAAVDLLKNSQVEAIMGPLTSAETEFVAYLCNRSQVPLLSFSATSPAISPTHLPFFIRANLNDSSQSIPIAAFIQHFGWREAVPIYEESEFGSGIIPSLVDALQSIDTMIPDRVVIPTEVSDDHIDNKLYRLMTQQTRVFVVHMLPALASRFFHRVQALGMMSAEYVWIVTDSVGDVLDILDPDVKNVMEGVIGFRTYFAFSDEVKSFKSRFKERFRQDNPGSEVADPTIYQLWAYDAVWALAKAVEKADVTNSSFVIPSSNSSSTDLSTLGVSETGPKLLSAILGTTLNGLAGNFRLVDGQLQLLAFEIVNVVGKGTRNIGFWTPDKGIIREIDSLNDSGNVNNLKNILWPGDLIVAPKGWVVPSNGKVLRIAVPAKAGFGVFVNVSGPTSEVSGYCIDVFNAVLSKLPYSLQYEFFPLSLSYSYNDMVYQVYLKKYDALVGDVTIRANRTNYVDFTMPYTESGVSMIVLLQSDSSQSMWIFLKPLTAQLWLISLAFFIFTGFVVWVIEHRINPEFRGTPWQQFGLIYYFAFSTLVFAHKEKLESNLSRFLVIIWVFVVLILTSSYTASLTSMLTVQQLQPSVTDVNQLLKQGDYVGFQDGSFVMELLLKLGFDPGKLKNLTTADDYADALAKGSAKGGVAAIFDEIPYLKVFLSQYCENNYAMVGPTYKTDGFGFVFPRGSPLLQDMSRAVLSVTEGEDMTRIEKKWLGKSNECTSSSTSMGSSSLSFRSFAGLFIITGSVSGLMLLIYIGMFLYREWERLSTLRDDHETPWEIIVAWFRHYDQFDRKSPTFKEYVRSSMSLEGSQGRLEGQIGLTGSRSPGNRSDQSAEMSFEFSQGGMTPPSGTDSGDISNRGPTEEIELAGQSRE
ncbi:glutamate receptor 2.2 [Rhynchospora pubera]|uniref:Glutamate receptor n=1 Tax=Rhynchospora pubera TaxID=906938 RepID=A0AAV8HGB2_9POAL|nr:glutamate receptor 2.2 [Rhynchospora pubera]